MHLAPTGCSTGCSSKSFFLLHTTAHLVGVNTAGDEGYPVLWESSERPDGVAKIVPLSERLSGMRGSVQHRRNLALWGGLGIVHHPAISDLYYFINRLYMRVLIACEYSGIVRDAFIRKGHNALSCDLLPTEIDGPHYQGNVENIINDGWDLMICHPPCTHLAVSGARWFKEKQREQVQALEFVDLLLNAPVDMICLENPVSIISSRIRKPDQIIQPWQYGHGETKATCLWLKNLPLLQPTKVVEGREARVHKMAPGPDRWKERSRTYTGIAAAMAEQWG